MAQLIKPKNGVFQHKKLGQQAVSVNRTAQRNLLIEKPIVGEDLTLTLSVSSNLPYDRHYYVEVLKHDQKSVDLSRFQNGAMVLYNHNRDDYVGVVEKAWLSEGKLFCQIRFDSHELAMKIVRSINSGVMQNVSVGYQVEEYILLEEVEDDDRKIDLFVATRWAPFEFSFVTVPADFSVGVGRKELEDQLNEALHTKTQNTKTQNTKTQNTKTQNTNMSQDTVIERNYKQEERERVQGILALSAKHGHPELAERAINEDLSIVDTRSLYLDKVSTKTEQEPVATGVKPVGMSNKERRRYSVLKAVGYAAGKIKESEVGLELEVSETLTQRIGKPPKSIYLDQAELVSYRAPYETGVPAAAGNLISTDLLSDRFIDQLYNMSAFLNAGVTYMRDLVGNIQIPRETTYTTGYWIPEAQTITEDEGTFDLISLSPHKLAVFSRITYEMIVQASIDIEMHFRNRLLRGLALELDRTIGFGSGIGSEPLGIASHPETQSVILGVNGAPLDWAGLVALQTEVADVNGLTTNQQRYIMNQRTRGKLMTTLDQSTGGGRWLYDPLGSSGVNNGTVAGYEAYISNQIPNNLVKGTANNLTAIFFGDFSQVLLALWSGMDLDVNPYGLGFREAIIDVRALQLADINLTRGDFFAIATDVQNN